MRTRVGFDFAGQVGFDLFLVDLDVVLLEAGQIDRQLIAVFLLPDIGLHQILGVLAI